MSTLTTYTPPGADLDAVHASWTGNRSNAHRRIAEAVQRRDHATLWSACAAMLTEGDGVSDNTITTYRAGALRYLEWCDANGVNVLRPDDDVGGLYRRDLMRAYSTLVPSGDKMVRRPNAGSVNTRLAGAKVIYRMLKRFKVEHANPFEDVKGVRERRKANTIRPAYTERQVVALLANATDPEDRVLVLLGSDAGLRVSEMIALDWSHVTLPERDASGAWATAGSAIVHGKGSTTAVVPLGDELLDALADLPHRVGPVLTRARTPSGLRYRLNRLAARAGGFGITKPRDPRAVALGIHRLRHRFATDVVAQYGLAVGQEACRHANVATTTRYVHDQQRAVADFVRGLRRAA
jgi:integrase/recombinase XerC